MLYILPLAFIFSGVFFPLGVVIYWFVSNLWTMVQQFVVIREMPTPGSDAAKAREERLARKGKAIDSSGKVISMEKYQAEQQRLLEEAERARGSAEAAAAREQAARQEAAGPQASGHWRLEPCAGFSRSTALARRSRLTHRILTPEGRS